MAESPLSPLIDREEVDYVAALAHLSFTQEEGDEMAASLSGILSLMEELQDIDTTGVEPTTHVLPLFNVFREDVVGTMLPREQALSNAPDKTEDSFKVPKIL